MRWLSPSDPSINHNIASKTRHKGTAQWFFQSSLYKQWKSTDPFLWVHGKRALFLAFTTLRTLIISSFYSGFGEKCRLVRLISTHSAHVKLTSSIQFIDHTRCHDLVRCREGFPTCFPLSSSNFLLGPIPVAMYSPVSILRTTVECGNPTIALW